ncbi:MAG: hypothetical protein FWF92_01070 [Oscillospiraceae bacterium]|nr:hypothetical protein [Oscillospiraceae bacterium]
MFKKILAFVFLTVLLFTMAAIPATAAPYNGGATISGEKTVVYAVNFDTDDYNEFTAELAEAGNWTWYFDSRDSGANYAHRTEYQENQNGPQTEAAEVSDFGEIGGICYTHGADDNHPDPEWVQYTINVETAGKYDLKVWASTDAADKSVNIYWQGALVGSPSITKEGWTTYNIFDVGSVDLAKGNGVMKLEWPAGDANIGAFEFILLEAAPTEAAEEGETPADEDGAAADNNNSSDNKSDEDGNNMILWIIIGAAAVVVIIIIVVLVTKKKN